MTRTPTAAALTIIAFPFCVQTRYGPHRSVGLRFPYDPAVIATLKASLRRHARHGGGGGWSPSRRCWWVNPDVWPWVQMDLAEAGYIVEVRE